MDRRFRQLERAYKESGDVEVHARLLSLAISRGVLTYESVLCAAFFGHKAAKIACCDDVKPSGVVFNGELLHNIEIKDLLNNITKWSFGVIARACFGICRKLAPRYNATKVLSECIQQNSLESLKYCFDKARIMPRYVGLRNATAYRIVLMVCKMDPTSSLFRQKSNKASKPLMAPILYLSDEDIRDGIQQEVFPFLLGQYT